MKKFFSILLGLLLSSCSNNVNQSIAFGQAVAAFEGDSSHHVASPASPVSTIVSFKGSVTIPYSKGFDAHAAFAEGGSPNFSRWDDFGDVYKKMGNVGAEPKQMLTIYDLKQKRGLSEIVGAIHAYPMTVAQFATVLAYLISKQPNGESGILTTNGNWNIFYVEIAPGQSVAVSVRWRSVYSIWSLGGGSLGSTWGTGNQVFLRNGSGS